MNVNNETSSAVSEEEILQASDEEYMNAVQLQFFKTRLLELHVSTSARIEESKKQIFCANNSSDENDRASIEEQSNIALRILEREQKLLPKIREALERIRLGDYGYCKETGEAIGIPRLLARPTAEYCAEVKAIKEQREHHFKD